MDHQLKTERYESKEIENGQSEFLPFCPKKLNHNPYGNSNDCFAKQEIIKG